MRINNYFLKMTPIELLLRNAGKVRSTRAVYVTMDENWSHIVRAAIITTDTGQRKLLPSDGNTSDDVFIWAHVHADVDAAAWQPLSTLHENAASTCVEILHTSGAIYVHSVTHTEPTQHGVTLAMCPALDPTATHWRLAKCA